MGAQTQINGNPVNFNEVPILRSIKGTEHHSPVKLMETTLVEIAIPPEIRDDLPKIRALVLKKAGIHDGRNVDIKIVRRSLDARKKDLKYILKVELTPKAEEPDIPKSQSYRDVSDRPSMHIIGAGPAGYFAALELIQQGLKPIVIERGKDVRERRRDLRAVQQFGIVNPDSNYCFGEGGAGTYSDGKLYTRATKRGDVSTILQILVDHGADPDILIDAHPHIGSNKLPGIVAAIRNTIIASGGEVRFNTRLTDIRVREGRLVEIILDEKELVPVEDVILATGHSARDIYRLLHRYGIAIEFKPFALGVRVEHPQALIDTIQYGQQRGKWLPAAAYQLTCQVDARGVFTFCMCPGGLIVPASTAPGEIVVNGMSLSRRDSPFANSGFVTSVDKKDITAYLYEGPLAGITFQSEIEQNCFAAGDGTQRAPAQRLTDFLNDKASASLPDTSYIPGIFSHSLSEVLPSFVTQALRKGLRRFGKMMPGYITEEAVAVATESRTSAPVRIPRDDRTRMHPQIKGLYPCGEGAGYAGGIVSAALDGQNVARAVAVMYSEGDKQLHR
ncbi:MAG TPA: hypothetical protein VI603_15455 [Saprospiraceae bacterium]|nr:hypothetical protein [Saprospiraceae bacterium]